MEFNLSKALDDLCEGYCVKMENCGSMGSVGPRSIASNVKMTGCRYKCFDKNDSPVFIELKATTDEKDVTTVKINTTSYTLDTVVDDLEKKYPGWEELVIRRYVNFLLYIENITYDSFSNKFFDDVMKFFDYKTVVTDDDLINNISINVILRINLGKSHTGSTYTIEAMKVKESYYVDVKYYPFHMKFPSNISREQLLVACTKIAILFICLRLRNPFKKVILSPSSQEMSTRMGPMGDSDSYPRYTVVDDL